MGLSDLHRELALWLGRQAESNRVMLEVRLRTFTYGLVGLLLEVVGVLVALGLRPCRAPLRERSSLVSASAMRCFFRR